MTLEKLSWFWSKRDKKDTKNSVRVEKTVECNKIKYWVPRHAINVIYTFPWCNINWNDTMNIMHSHFLFKMLDLGLKTIKSTHIGLLVPQYLLNLILSMASLLWNVRFCGNISIIAIMQCNTKVSLPFEGSKMIKRTHFQFWFHSSFVNCVPLINSLKNRCNFSPLSLLQWIRQVWKVECCAEKRYWP